MSPHSTRRGASARTRRGALALDALLVAGRDGSARAELARIRLDPDELVVFQLSGGTTGLPEIAPRRHHEYLYNARAWARSVELGPESVVLHPLPIMHNAGTSAALQPAHLAGAACVVSSGAEAGVVLGLIATEHVSVVPVVPPAVAIRLQARTPAGST